MATLRTYKCPCCGGSIGFDSNIQKLKCPYCDTEFELDTLRSFDDTLRGEKPDEMNWETDSGESWQDEDAQTLRSYVCKSCGGEIVGDATMAAASCPFCGNPVVMLEKLSGALRPDLVIPFKLDKAAAKAALKKHYEGKKLLPRIFRDENHIDEIKGLYIPVWLFDAKANASVRYRGIRVRTWHDSRYDYTETQHYAINRAGSLDFTAVPVDGSEKMPNEMTESIEPFDLSDGVDFQTAYLAGYFADCYDVDADRSVERANERIRSSTEQTFLNTVHGFMSVTPEHTDLQLSDTRVRYALCPVWLLNTTWNGKKYQFLMNGQTGRMVGDLPIDMGLKRKYFWTTFGITAAAVIAVQAIASLL